MYMGDGKFVWFQGVVEDRDDPLKLGRLRVRCLGWHTENKTLIPTTALPWAHPISPINSASMNGIGMSPTGPVEGTWVIGFFRDGKNAQEPVVFGTIGGIPEDLPKKDKGFNDPNEKYPLEDGLKEPDTNRLTRNEDRTSTLVNSDGVDKPRELLVEKAIRLLANGSPTTNSTASVGTGFWSEPEDPYAAEYPKNHVRESESGHIEEWDDTSGAERLHRYHNSGTREEIHPNGDKVVRIVANNYVVIANSDHVLVKGDVNLTIDSDCNTYIKGDWNIQVDGDMSQDIKGSLTQTVAKGVLKTHKSWDTTIVTGTVIETYLGSQTTAVTGSVNEIYAAAQTTTALGNVKITSPRIDLN